MNNLGTIADSGSTAAMEAMSACGLLHDGTARCWTLFGIFGFRQGSCGCADKSDKAVKGRSGSCSRSSRLRDSICTRQRSCTPASRQPRSVDDDDEGLGDDDDLKKFRSCGSVHEDGGGRLARGSTAWQCGGRWRCWLRFCRGFRTPSAWT